MNKIKIRNYQIFSVIFTFVLGTLLHFTYKWSGENNIVALFSAVNESTWEHLKLIFFPMMLTTIIGYFYIGRKNSNFICSKTIGIFVSLLFMIVFYYTYTGIIGNDITILNIATFYISVILGEFIAYVLIINKFKCNNKISIILLTIICAFFKVFTNNAPNLGIFKDPLIKK